MNKIQNDLVNSETSLQLKMQEDNDIREKHKVPLHHSEGQNQHRVSTLVPIWALAHTHQIDHSTKATGVSTRRATTRPNPLQFSDTGSPYESPQIKTSYLQRSSTIPRNNTSSNMNNIARQQRPPRSSFNRYLHDGDDAVSEYDGTKTWIRSGNKWMITHSANRLASNANQSSSRTSNTAQKEASSPTDKLNPTAVSSYQKEGTDSTSPTNRLSELNKDSLTAINARWNTNFDSASNISSFAGSSATGLYTRQRMTMTPGGFPYMPALHLVRKKNFSSSGGISSASGISGAATSVGGLAEKRFQNSYLMNAKAVTGKSPTSEKKSKAEHRLNKAITNAVLERQRSGYDSEREERLREWKENFVQKYIGDENDLNNTYHRLLQNKTIDSDYDSDSNRNTLGLKERKELQHRGPKSRNGSPRNRRRPYGLDTTSPTITPSSSGLTNNIYSPLSPNDQSSPDLFSKDTFEDNDSTNYFHRMREWKEKQYNDHGASFRPLPTQVELSAESTSASRSLDYDRTGYDSDLSRESREQRLQEWKEKFAFGTLPKKGADRSESMTVGIGDIMADPLNSWSDQETDQLDTIHFSSKRTSRRGKEIPGGGLFPVTSPQRKNTRSRNTKPSVSQSRSGVNGHLPPTSPPKNSSMDDVATPQRVNISPREESDASKEQPKTESISMMKAAKFLLGLSPDSSSDEGPIVPTGNCLSTALDIHSPCRVLPSLPNNGQNGKQSEQENDLPGSDTMQAPMNLWRRTSSQHEGRENQFYPIGETPLNSMQSSDMDLPSWDNCLFVKAEGARTGRISISKTHLFFIFEDELSDAILTRYGWNREQVDDLLLDSEGPSSRAATPVNVPLDQSGHEEGIELVGSDESTVKFMDLIEDGFKDSDYHCNVNLEREKENLISHAESSGNVDSNHSSNGSSTTFSTALRNKSIVVNNIDNAPSFVTEAPFDRNFLHEIPPIALSSSSLESCSVEEMERTSIDANRTTSFGMASNEEVVNDCIIRAFNEEASMRMQQDELTASQSITQKSLKNTDPEDVRSLYKNDTNVSSFSEIDMEINPDQERTMYIADDLETKQKYIGIRWPLRKLSEVFDRRYMTKEVGVEIFAPSTSQLTTSTLRQATTASTSTFGGHTMDEVEVPLGPLSNTSLYLVIPGFDNRFSSRLRRRKISRRDVFIETLKYYASQLNDAFWLRSPRYQSKWEWLRNMKGDPLNALTRAWRRGYVSNYDYLMRLNAISGRSFHDPGSYPIMPWVLSNYHSDSIPDLADPRNYRDLSKPMGALYEERLSKFQEKYSMLCSIPDTAIPPFMYGSHYSNTGGVVLHYLVRKRPFAGLHRQLQVSVGIFCVLGISFQCRKTQIDF